MSVSLIRKTAGTDPLIGAQSDVGITLASGRQRLAAVVTGDDANNVLTGTDSTDDIAGLGGDDSLFGLGGDDTLDGGSGNDALDGGSGADEMTGGTGNDWYVADDLLDVILESAGGGDDRVLAAGN